jgi:anthranilate phosphoribosyltransferase
MIKKAISLLMKGKDLSFEQTQKVFLDIFEEKATPAQIAAFLVALQIKQPTYQEISAAATVIREKANKINVRREFLGMPNQEPVVDTCGTGGSGINKFNISTAIAFVVASVGLKVAKHGNRAMSSSCGSADVLEELGVNINASPKVMEEAIRSIGIGFLYAPLYHPAFRVVSPIRRELGIKTIFNILGPLCNPALADYQLLGVFSKDLMKTLAYALKNLGARGAFVFHSKDLGDEVSLLGPTDVAFLDGKKIKELRLLPSSFGLKRCKWKDLEVRDIKDSAQKILDIFEGKKGSCRDTVLAGASCCFYMLKKVKDLKEGVRLAGQLIDQGKVKEKFLEFRRFLQERDGL